MKKIDPKVEAKASDRGERPERPRYQTPRIVKKRAVSRATLFTGGGADGSGLTG